MGIDVTTAELAGARAYSRTWLNIYDLYVLGFNNHLVWRCPTRHLRALYDGHISNDHLDIGVGTGYFLRRATYPSTHPRLTLVDLSEPALAVTVDRLRARGLDPEVHIGSVLQPLPVERRRYGSVAANLLMHCVPGGWDSKGIAFAHVADTLAGSGVFFGSTVLNVGVPTNWLSRATSRAFNSNGIFHNEDDDLEGLRAALEREFSLVDIQMRGSMALWTARHPRREH
ncbi:class I SAM-dependent methyltransferase [Nocardia sp. NBC_01327]|uniref:class I SAM-dependent methyltransferase n=1 Tax=Nocardia sp. NBC_01327 TaxID=2903593 RepID=UPI002E0E1FC7|nr:class I SAM-dependent methyltransferase [Nocardia sp. NBC_01327]